MFHGHFIAAQGRARRRLIASLISVQNPENQIDVADKELAEAVEALGRGLIHIGVRRIIAGDENSLLPEEQTLFTRAGLKARRQSGAARIVARELMRRYGLGASPILKASSGAPIWPPGIKGSLAHDDEIAAATVTTDSRILSVGLDIEPALPLPTEMLDMIATPAERRIYPQAILSSRKLFVLKEAVYKATNPIDGRFLDFQDIEIDLANESALVEGGGSMSIKLAEASHLIGLAWIESE